MENTETIDVCRVVEAYKEKGMSDEEILKALSQLLEAGRIAQEDYEKAESMLKELSERSEAEKLFGMKFVA